MKDLVSKLRIGVDRTCATVAFEVPLTAIMTAALLIAGSAPARGEAHISSDPTEPRSAATVPNLAPEQRQQLEQSPQDATLAPWQREFMLRMLHDGNRGVVEGQPANPSRGLAPEDVIITSGSWTQEATPSARTRHTAIYDPVRDRMVVFGGAIGGGNDVWALSMDSVEWTPLTATGTPPNARNEHTAIYDPVRDRMVVFGGRDPNDYLLNDVWALSLAGTPEWTQLTTSGTPPSPRAGHVAIYDPVRDRMLVFGGSYNDHDVWALSLAGSPAWTKLNTAGTAPENVSDQPAIYDPVRDRMLLLDGCCYPYTFVAALSLAGAPTWTYLTPAGTKPPDRYGRSAIYDPVGDRVWLFGGELWTLSLGGTPTWTDQGARSGPTEEHTAIYDPVRERMVVYGGDGYCVEGAFAFHHPPTDAWAMSVTGGPWTHLMPVVGAAPNAYSPAIHDPVRERMVVFGFGCGGIAELWALSLAGSPAWTQLDLTGNLPYPRSDYTAIYDPVRDRVIVFGGYNYPTFFNDVWAVSLAGTPVITQLMPAGTPPIGRSRHTAIYDPVGDRMIVFGGTASIAPSHFLNDVWALSLAGTPQWTQIIPAGTPPSARYDHSAIDDPVRDRMVVFGGYDGDDYRNDVWALSLAGSPEWTQLAPSGTPPGTSVTKAAIYDPVRDCMVIFGGFGRVAGTGHVFNDVWVLWLSGGPMWVQLNPYGTRPSSGGSAIYDPGRDRMVLFGSGSGVSVWDLVWNLPLAVPGRRESPSSDVTYVSPNPIAGRARVQYVVARAGRVRLDLLDASGRVVATIDDRIQSAGSYSASWDGAGRLSPGLYFIRMRAPDRTSTKKLAIVR